ncbi:MAG: hypothetical protein ACE5JJ_08420 [Nitrospinota bacterium]
MWRFFSGDFGDLARVGFPLHPGAVRYWKEKGVSIPKNLIKG